MHESSQGTSSFSVTTVFEAWSHEEFCRAFRFQWAVELSNRQPWHLSAKHITDGFECSRSRGNDSWQLTGHNLIFIHRVGAVCWNCAHYCLCRPVIVQNICCTLCTKMCDRRTQNWHLEIALSHCQWLREEESTFLEAIVTDDTTLMRHFIQIKWAGMQQKHPVSPKSQKFKMCHSAGKVMTTVFWDAGVIPAEFMAQSTNHCECLLWLAVTAAWGYLQGEMWTFVAVCDSAAWQCNSTESTLDTRIVTLISLAHSRPSTLWTWPWTTEATLGKSPTLQWWGRINCCLCVVVNARALYPLWQNS